MINLFIAIVRFCQARKKSDRLFFLLHLLILDVNATFCPLQGVAMPIWHVNACYIVFFFLRKVKPLMRKWTKKGENAESAMFFISTVLSRRPKVTPLRLISVNFVRFLSSPGKHLYKKKMPRPQLHRPPQCYNRVTNRRNHLHFKKSNVILALQNNVIETYPRFRYWVG